MARQVGRGEQQVADLVGHVVGVVPRLHDLLQLLAHLGDGAPGIVPVEARLGRPAAQLAGVGQRRQVPVDAVDARRRRGVVGQAPLGPLDGLPVGHHVIGPGHLDVAEHVRVAPHHLLGDAPGHVGQREAALLLGDGRVQHHLEQHVAQLAHQLVVAGAVGTEQGDGLHQLVGLLHGVAGQAGVRLLAVPRALPAQPAHHLGEAHQLAAHGRGERRHVHGGQVVGGDLAVELGPRHGEDRLVGQAQALQHGHGLGRFVVHGQLHVREHALVVRVRHQQRAGQTGGRLGERVGVDQREAGLHRVDAQTVVGQVEEAERGQHLHVDPGIGAQPAHRPLEHQR